MEKKYSAEVPVKVERKGTKRTLIYGVYELSESEIKELWDKSQRDGVKYDYFAKEHKYGYYSAVIPMGQWSYDGVINAIVRDKYRTDEMEAITNNMAAINAVFMQTLVKSGIVEAIKFLRERADDADAETFREMQEWRAMAKKEAKGIFGVLSSE